MFLVVYSDGTSTEMVDTLETLEDKDVIYSSYNLIPGTISPEKYGLILANNDYIPEEVAEYASIIEDFEEAVKGYGKGEQTYKTLVVVTDGEEEEGQAENAAQKAKDKGIKIYTVGVGTKEGDLIQVPDESGQPEFLKDAQGNVVKSRLNENVLQQIAYITGGAYARSSGAQFGLDYLYDQQLSKLEKSDIEAKQTKRYHERFQWPLAVALAFLLAETLIATTRSKSV